MLWQHLKLIDTFQKRMRVQKLPHHQCNVALPRLLSMIRLLYLRFEKLNYVKRNRSIGLTFFESRFGKRRIRESSAIKEVSIFFTKVLNPICTVSPSARTMYLSPLVYYLPCRVKSVPVSNVCHSRLSAMSVSCRFHSSLAPNQYLMELQTEPNI